MSSSYAVYKKIHDLLLPGTSAHRVLSASLVSRWVAQRPHSPAHLGARCFAALPVRRSSLTSLTLEPSWPWDSVGWENVLEVALCQAILCPRLVRCCPLLSPSWNGLSHQVNKPERTCWKMRDPAQVTVDLTSLTVAADTRVSPAEPRITSRILSYCFELTEFWGGLLRGNANCYSWCHLSDK